MTVEVGPEKTAEPSGSQRFLPSAPLPPPTGEFGAPYEFVSGLPG